MVARETDPLAQGQHTRPTVPSEQARRWPTVGDGGGRLLILLLSLADLEHSKEALWHRRREQDYPYLTFARV